MSIDKRFEDMGTTEQTERVIRLQRESRDIDWARGGDIVEVLDVEMLQAYRKWQGKRACVGELAMKPKRFEDMDAAERTDLAVHNMPEYERRAKDYMNRAEGGTGMPVDDETEYRRRLEHIFSLAPDVLIEILCFGSSDIGSGSFPVERDKAIEVIEIFLDRFAGPHGRREFISQCVSQDVLRPGASR